jgi:hypothetical protein
MRGADEIQDPSPETCSQRTPFDNAERWPVSGIRIAATGRGLPNGRSAHSPHWALFVVTQVEPFDIVERAPSR